MNLKKIVLYLVLTYLLVYIIPLGMRGLHVPDETRYAEIPREMIASGNWVVPHLSGLRYFEKPDMGYWLNAISISVFGENAFAVRLPTALSAGLSAVMLFLLLFRFGGGYKQAATGAAAFLSCLLVFVLGIYAVLDGMLAVMLTVALVLFFFSYQAENRRSKLIMLALFGVFCAFAFMIKGFLAFVIPVVVIGPFLLLDKKWKDIIILPWVPLIMILVVAVPWGITIHLQEGDFWNYFFWEEHIARFAAKDADHREPFWYYIPVIIGGAIPWVFMFPAAIAGLFKSKSKDVLVKYALCWLVFPFLFFSASKGKLGTYILPLYIPLMLLFAIGIWRYMEDEGRKLFNGGAVLSGLLAIILFVLFLVFPFDKIEDVAFLEYIPWVRVFICGSLLFWGVMMFKAVKSKSVEYSIAYCCMAPVLFFLAMDIAISQVHVLKHEPSAFIAEHYNEIGSDSIVVSDNYMGPAVCWYLKRNDIYVLESKGELKYGLLYPDSEYRYLSFDTFRRMIADNHNNKSVVLIVGEHRYHKFGDNLPVPTKEYIKDGYVFLLYL